MKFTVIWSEMAIQDLARIWVNAADRAAITSASNEIDRILSRDPQHVGEARPGGQRVAFADPLGFRFEVVVDDLRVTVGAVWVTRTVSSGSPALDEAKSPQRFPAGATSFNGLSPRGRP